MLVLFDIDGTLLLTDGAGARAMVEAGRRLVGAHFDLDGIEIAGCLDPLIWADAAQRHVSGRPAVQGRSAVSHERFRAEYASILAERLGTGEVSRLLPGVAELLDRLGSLDGVGIGLVTGNYPETGRLKIEAAGLDPDLFVAAAWGCDGRSRRDLPRVAIERYVECTGRRPAPADVVVIGDTPHDIDCARATGCRSLAVATGPSHSIDELLACEPDRAVEDLSDTDDIVRWLTSGSAA